MRISRKMAAIPLFFLVFVASLVVGAAPVLATQITFRAECNGVDPGVPMAVIPSGGGTTPFSVQLLSGQPASVVFPTSFPFQGGTCVSQSGTDHLELISKPS